MRACAPGLPTCGLPTWLLPCFCFPAPRPCPATRIRREIEGTNLFGLSVMLADEMIDPEQPVTVVVNGETMYSGLVERRPAAVLESILENLDPQQVFAYQVDLEE